jgi:hypothetical protein
MNTVFRLRTLAAALALALLIGGCSAAPMDGLRAVTPLPPAPGPGAPAEPAPAAVTPQPADQPSPQTDQRSPQASPPATPTPLSLNLPEGSALAIAQATDTALQPAPKQRLYFDASPVPLTFDEFYDGYNVRTGLALSDKLLSLDGQEVVLEGYMAPPLKAELDWFVLTRIRLSYCPFCSTAADWPDDIALVYLTDAAIRPTERPLRLYGRLEVGPAVDPETGMVSVVRIYATRLEPL